MKVKGKEKIREEAIELYLQGYNFSQIGEKLHFSRQYIANLIKNDERVQSKRNSTTLKVYKNYKNRKMRIGFSTAFLTEIGISKDCSIVDYVDIFLDKENEQIVIKKHKK